MLLWNALLPGLFGIKTISFWQAIGINLLTGIMFRSHSSSSSRVDKLNMREVHVLITGGTIDKVYDACTGAMVHHESSIERLLRKGRCSVPYITSTYFSKDNLLMSDTDRQCF